ERGAGNVIFSWSDQSTTERTTYTPASPKTMAIAGVNLWPNGPGRPTVRLARPGRVAGPCRWQSVGRPHRTPGHAGSHPKSLPERRRRSRPATQELAL